MPDVRLSDRQLPAVPQVLIPFDAAEALSIWEATRIAGRSDDTVRRWAHLNDLGRRIGGRWMISRYALAMFLNGDKAALRAYLAGDRVGPLVAPYLDAKGGKAA